MYSLEEAYLHLLSYSPQGFFTRSFFTTPQGLTFLTALRAFLHEVLYSPAGACIRFYDLFHEGVPYDVLLVKFNDGNAANVLQPLDSIAQS